MECPCHLCNDSSITYKQLFTYKDVLSFVLLCNLERLRTAFCVGLLRNLITDASFVIIMEFMVENSTEDSEQGCIHNPSLL